PSPRIRAGASVAEDAARDDERVLVLRYDLGQHVELAGEVELRLDVRLASGRADERVVPFCPAQEPDRLREDRLARPRFAGDRVPPGREVELRPTDQDEILEAKAAQHTARVEAR